jgi:membrane fusion protein (multidrug efflux system)
VPGRYAGMIKVGQKIEFYVEENDGVKSAKVYAFESSINENTRMLKVKALCPNSNNSIKPGSFVKVSIEFWQNFLIFCNTI